MIWNKDLRIRLFAALSSIRELRYLSIDFGQADAFLNEEVPHPPFRCPALLVSDIREELEVGDKELDRYRLSFTLKLITDDARFATQGVPEDHLAAYDTTLSLSDDVIDSVLPLHPHVTFLARTEAQLRESLRLCTLSFSITEYR